MKQIVLFFCLGVAIAWCAVPSAAEESVLEVEQGIHKLLRQSGPVKRLAVGDPGIADVNVINRRELLITGKSPGVTSLLVWLVDAGEPLQYRVRVGVAHQEAVAGQPKTPDPELKEAVIEPGKSLEGRLPNLLAHRRAKQEAQAGAKQAVTDNSVIDLETQVMAEIKIAEVSRRTLQQYGINALQTTANALVGLSPPGAISGVTLQGGAAGFTSGSGFLPLQSAFNLVVGDPSRGLLGVLSLLESKGLARTLAEPSLVAMSGQTASFLAGGEFPVPVSQGGASGGAITIQYKEFGVRLSLTPTVLSRDRIALKVAPEVSDLDFSSAVQVGGVAVPALTVRRTDTTVELGDGESFVISGLVSNNLITNVDKVPWLGDVPILGAFFKSARYTRDEKELIMVVTPHLVRPMQREAKLPQLPGENYDRYRPSTAGLIFLETGDFNGAQTGYGK